MCLVEPNRMWAIKWLKIWQLKSLTACNSSQPTQQSRQSKESSNSQSKWPMIFFSGGPHKEQRPSMKISHHLFFACTLSRKSYLHKRTQRKVHKERDHFSCLYYGILFFCVLFFIFHIFYAINWLVAWDNNNLMVFFFFKI